MTFKFKILMDIKKMQIKQKLINNVNILNMF